MDKKVVTLDRGWSLILRDIELQPENILRRAGLPRDLLTDEQERVTVEEYFRLWNAIDAEANDPELPIRLGLAMTPEAFHPSIFAALCSPDYLTAVRRIALYKRLHAPVTLSVEVSASTLFVGKQWDDPQLEIPAALAATELVFLTQIARIGTRERVCPLRVESRSAMRPSSAYRNFFGVTPVESDRHGVTLVLLTLDVPS